MTSLLILVISTMTIRQDIESLAASLSFPRREFSDFQLEDLPFDWFDIDSGEGINRVTFPNLESVTYESNGNVLNATLWLSTPLDKNPLAHTPSYGMLIDIDPLTIYSPSSSGWEGADYMLRISWNNKTGSWDRIFEEWLDGGYTRILDNKTNFLQFPKRENVTYIDISVEMPSIGNPDQYNIIFFAALLHDPLGF
jgi:hypothetical protein